MTNRTCAMRSNDSTPARRLIVAPSSDPLMDKALARARRARREQAVAHTLQAADLAEAAGWTEGAAGFRADAALMLQAITS
jgi:hypothetical protein